MPRQTLSTRIFSSSALNTAGLVLILVLLLVSFARVLWRDRDLRHEERQLEADLLTEQSEQERMRSMVAYLKSSDYIESEARKTYGFAKPGEQVVVFQDTRAIGKNTVIIGSSNARKWYSYFFENTQVKLR
jgi:cell division protein FtsB